MDHSFLKASVVEPEAFSQEGKSFLDRMRHPSSYELVQQVKTFVLTFTTMEGPPDSFSSYLQGFLEDLSMLLIAHPQWREDGEKGLKDALEAMERYLLQKLYSTAFYIPTSTDSEDDEKFYHRVRILQFLQPDHLDIKERAFNTVAFEMAARELSRLEEDVLKSPKEKLQCVINAVIIIINLLKKANSEGTGADDILPYLIYLVLLTSPKHIHSNLRYIRRFRRPSLLTSEEAYYLTHMESAVMFISTLDHTSLSISQEDYEKGIQENQSKIKAGRDVPRRFSRSISWEDGLIAASNKIFKDHTPSSSSIAEEKVVTDHVHPNGNQRRSRDGPQLPVEGAPVAFPVTDKSDKEVIMVPEREGQQRPLIHTKPSFVADLIKPKFLSTSFEHLTIQELQQLHQCYLKLCRQLQLQHSSALSSNCSNSTN